MESNIKNENQVPLLNEPIAQLPKETNQTDT